MNADGSTVDLASVGGSAGITLTFKKDSNKEISLYLTTDTDSPSTLIYSVDSTYNGKCTWYIDGNPQGSLNDRNELVANSSNTFTLNTNTDGYKSGMHTLMVMVTESKKSYSKTVQFKVVTN